jgi:CRISPR-associated protein Csc1
MTIIYRCTLELHDSLYFATREIGRLYETEPVLHNYALTYALGLVDSDRYATSVAKEDSYTYFCAEQVPKYKQHLLPLNERGIYVTPARAIHYASILSTWKYANNNYHVVMEKMERNIPGFGRTKEIAPESQFEFFVISKTALDFPRWIRIGKWASKAEIITQPLTIRSSKTEEMVIDIPLNPLDVMFMNQVLSYDTINIPPVSLIRNVRMIGEHYTFEELPDLKLPARMQYEFGN